MQELLKELPYQLRKDVCRDLFRSIINGVALFKHTEKHFLDTLATKFTSIVIPAGEYVFHQGDLGSEMYFVADGECAVIIDSKQVSEGVLQSAEPTSPASRTRLQTRRRDRIRTARARTTRASCCSSSCAWMTSNSAAPTSGSCPPFRRRERCRFSQHA